MNDGCTCNEYTFGRKALEEHADLTRKVLSDGVLRGNLAKVGDLIVNAYKNGGKLLVCGNGGSAADAQHIAAELVGRFYLERKPLEAESLTVNTSILTAIGNDYDYNDIFQRQVESKGRTGDVLLGISTSGNSKNIVSAVTKAKEMGLITVGLLGGNQNSELFKMCHCSISIPSTNTPRVQEIHILIGHVLCEYIESQLFSKSQRK
ncbi:Phosphoheptose isomerase [uncultured archaeon]|nr:Phosphoheptose isomerase [uncultured archaeon]